MPPKKNPSAPKTPRKKAPKKIYIAQPYVIYIGVPLTSLNNCKIIGIDPARCNPGIDVEIRTGEMVETLLLVCQDIPSLTTVPLLGPTHNYTYAVVTQYLVSIYPMIHDAKVLVSEKQPRKVGRVSISEDAMRVGQHIISWCMINIPGILILEVDSRMRREILSISSASIEAVDEEGKKKTKSKKKTELKDKMVEEAYRIAVCRNDTMVIKKFGDYLKNLSDQRAAGKIKLRRPFRCHDMADSKIIVEIGMRCLGLVKNV